jgi:hypothetical protein
MSDGKLRDRFNSKVDTSAGPDGCHEWTGYLDPVGYGRLFRGVNKSPHWAHRLAWELANGEIGEGLYVCHHCDNKKCVNASHLFLGSNRDNAIDASSKGRLNSQTPKRDVDLIRFLSRSGWTGVAIASEIGIKKNTVRNIIRGTTNALQ